jgi:hypothetical protein
MSLLIYQVAGAGFKAGYTRVSNLDATLTLRDGSHGLFNVQNTKLSHIPVGECKLVSFCRIYENMNQCIMEHRIIE